MRQLRRPARRLAAALALALAAPLAACGDSTAPLLRINDVEYAPALGVDFTQGVRTEFGMYYRDIGEPGTGALAEVGKEVEVTYIGWLYSGEQFDASSPELPTLKFTVGSGEMIPGFDEGVRGMRVGGRRQLVIPPALGYGHPGRPPRVPGNYVIVFDVRLVGVK